MSSRQDTYKSLCLIEAQKSPLHYRHGCIIVRGGKVIGKGHNHYRTGFNGGALSTGKTSSPPVSAVGASLFLKKDKPENKPKPNSREISGGGKMANTPLSMHSEMMAIRAALSLSAHDSGASARGTAWSVKPSSRLSGHSKRVARLRNYVEAICAEAEKAGGRIDYGGPYRVKSGVLKRLHLDSSLLNNKVPNEPKLRQKNEQKHGKKEKNREYHHHGYQYQNSYPHDGEIGNASESEASLAHGKVGSTGHHILKPVGQSVTSRASLTQRKTDSRLRGADLYVARLAWRSVETNVNAKSVPASDLDSLSSSMSSLLTDTGETPPTGSLHEELSCLSRAYSSSSTVEADPSTPVPVAVSSHPCYRCVSYMYAAGIRRVFWTNNDGGWESGKVRDLMDLLQDGDDATTNVYVSKHEVLMLRRQMGWS